MPGFYGSNPNDTATALMSHARALEERADTRARFVQHDRDEALWRLEPYVLEEVTTFRKVPEHWPSVTLNGPRTLWMALRRSVTANGPRFRIQLPGLTLNPDYCPIHGGNVQDGCPLCQAAQTSFAKGLDETSRVEKFATGVCQMVDEQRIRAGLQPLQPTTAWQVGIRGGCVARVWFDPDRRYPFSVQLWDPREVVYESGLDGLSYACHHYRAPLYDVRARYPEVDGITADEYGNVEIYDCWWLEDDTVYNCVFAPGRCLQEPQEMPKIDHLPIFVVRMSGPDIEDSYDVRREQIHATDAWESIYAANRDTYPLLNRIATLYSLYLRNGAIGPYIFEGSGMPSNDQIAKNITPFGVISGEKISGSPLSPPSMAAEAKEFFAQLQGSEQRGGVPYSVYGQVQSHISGFAINQLQGAVGILAQPLANAMSWTYRLIIDECLSQFRARGRKMTLRGMDRRRQPFIEDIKRADIRDKYYLEVEIAPELPMDKLQEAQVAQAWAAIGIDPVTIGDEVLGIQDVRQVIERMMAWQVVQQEAALKAQMMTAMQQAQAGFPPNGGKPGVDPAVMPPSYQDPSLGMNNGMPDGRVVDNGTGAYA